MDEVPEGSPLAGQARTLDHLSRIGQDITASFEFSEIFEAIERRLGELLDAETLYIGLLDPAREWIDIPLFVDDGKRAPSRRLRVDDPARPASLCVRENREVLSHKTLEQAIRNDLPGTKPTLTALFRPLVVQNRMIGMMSVQSARPHAYQERERLIFRALCSYAAVALANAESFRRLAAVEALEILGEVAQDVTSSLQVETILASLERHVGRLLAPSAFRIGLLAPDGRHLNMPLSLRDGVRLPPARLASDDPSAPERQALAETREVTFPGPPAIVARPLVAAAGQLGVIVLERQEPLDGRERLVFRTLASYVAIALANARAYADAELARAEATGALDTLRRTQESLIQAEKMASLGQLVAGVAHEVNTPVGTALTVATEFERAADGFRRKVEDGALRRSDLDGFVGKAGEAARQLTANLMRASDLVGRFKDVAADRAHDERRPFRLAELVDAIMTSLTSELRRHGVRVELEVPPEIEPDSLPGALGQVLIILVMNALTHAFPDERAGNLRISAALAGTDAVAIEVVDDGAGIPEAVRHRIFDPFFTTRRHGGSTGLGLHIAYNLTAKTLGGHILCRSEPGAGSTFRIEIPLRLPVEQPSSGRGA